MTGAVPQFPYSRGDLPFTHMPSPSTSQTGFQNMFQPPSQSSQYPSNTNNVPPSHFVSPSQVHTTQQYNFQTPNEQQHLPLRNDGQLASSNIYDSLIDMTSFESQLLDMSTTAFGGQENTSNGDWWSRLFSDYMWVISCRKDVNPKLTALTGALTFTPTCLPPAVLRQIPDCRDI